LSAKSSIALAIGFLQSLELALALLRTSSRLARRALSMPRLASISDGVRSNCRLASDTVVLPRMLSSTSADFRRAVQRLISSSITALIRVSL
jgi:hypothetical protein